MRKNWLCFAKITFMCPLPYPTRRSSSLSHIFIFGGELVALMPALFPKIITRARKAWVPGEGTQVQRRNWLCSSFSCGVELSCACTLADDIDRSSAPPQHASLCSASVFLSLRLQKNWVCFANLEIGFICRAALNSSRSLGTVSMNSRRSYRWKAGAQTTCWQFRRI